MRTNRDDGDQDRNAEKGAGHSPKEPEEKYGEDDGQRRDRQRRAGDDRLKIIADGELDREHAEKDDEGVLPALELRHGEEAGQQRRYEGTNKGDVIQDEGEDAPGRRQLEAGEERNAADCKPGERAHLRADEHIFAKLCGDLLADLGEVRPFCLLARRGEPLAEIAGLKQGQHQEHEGEDSEAEEGMDVPDEGLKEAHEPYHVEPFGQGAYDEDLMIFQPARPFEIDG